MEYTEDDKKRQNELSNNYPYRSEWRRDYGRLVHSPAFRRLQGKTQLFPGIESDFFRNRLTHSLEVAQIAKSITNKLNYDLTKKKEPYFIEPDVVEFAGLAHDLGHPPFGHLGEAVLDELMIDDGGFEANAQTLRILTKIDKRENDSNFYGIDIFGNDVRVGSNLTYRSLASILKYNTEIPETETGRLKKGYSIDKPVKGYYCTESDIVERIAENVFKTNVKGFNSFNEIKTIECQIMDIADDIAYSTYDLEDSFKAGFIKPMDMIVADNKILSKVAKKVSKVFNQSYTEENIWTQIVELFGGVFKIPMSFKKELTNEFLEEIYPSLLAKSQSNSNKVANNGYFRSKILSALISNFIDNVNFVFINHNNPSLSKIELKNDKRLQVEILKNYSFESQIMSSKLKIVEFRGKDIVEGLFNTISKEKGFELLPEDFKTIYTHIRSEDKKELFVILLLE